MAKAGKFGKFLKKVQSIGKSNRGTISPSNSNRSDSSVSSTGNNNLCPVYVGKTRRRYLISPDVLEHQLFRELVERSSASCDDEIVVGCEVVLFEHLLWMLENADPQPESMDELVDFYAC